MSDHNPRSLPHYKIRILLYYVTSFCFSAIIGLSNTKTPFVRGYHLGESIDTEVTINGIDRSNLVQRLSPTFGVREIGFAFEKNNLLGLRVNSEDEANEEANTVSFQFEDGLWVLPTLSLTKEHYIQHPEFLDNVVIQFVISKSGIGTIHSVIVKESVYSKEHTPYIYVHYDWIEENAVSLSAGHAVMFLLIFLFAVYFLLVSCGFVTTDEISNKNNRINEIAAGYGQQLSVPKSD